MKIKQLLKILAYSYENLKLYPYAQTSSSNTTLKFCVSTCGIHYCQHHRLHCIQILWMTWHGITWTKQITWQLLYLHTKQWHTNVEHCELTQFCYPKMTFSHHHRNSVFFVLISAKCQNHAYNKYITLWVSILYLTWKKCASFHIPLLFCSANSINRGLKKLHMRVLWFQFWPNEWWWNGWECDTFWEEEIQSYDEKIWTEEISLKTTYRWHHEEWIIRLRKGTSSGVTLNRKPSGSIQCKGFIDQLGNY